MAISLYRPNIQPDTSTADFYERIGKLGGDFLRKAPERFEKGYNLGERIKDKLSKAKSLADRKYITAYEFAKQTGMEEYFLLNHGKKEDIEKYKKETGKSLSGDVKEKRKKGGWLQSLSDEDVKKGVGREGEGDKEPVSRVNMAEKETSLVEEPTSGKVPEPTTQEKEALEAEMAEDVEEEEGGDGDLSAEESRSPAGTPGQMVTPEGYEWDEEKVSPDKKASTVTRDSLVAPEDAPEPLPTEKKVPPPPEKKAPPRDVDSDKRENLLKQMGLTPRVSKGYIDIMMSEDTSDDLVKLINTNMHTYRTEKERVNSQYNDPYPNTSPIMTPGITMTELYDKNFSENYPARVKRMIASHVMGEISGKLMEIANTTGSVPSSEEVYQAVMQDNKIRGLNALTNEEIQSVIDKAFTSEEFRLEKQELAQRKAEARKKKGDISYAASEVTKYMDAKIAKAGEAATALLGEMWQDSDKVKEILRDEGIQANLKKRVGEDLYNNTVTLHKAHIARALGIAKAMEQYEKKIPGEVKMSPEIAENIAKEIYTGKLTEADIKRLDSVSRYAKEQLSTIIQHVPKRVADIIADKYNIDSPWEDIETVGAGQPGRKGVSGEGGFSEKNITGEGSKENPYMAPEDMQEGFSSYVRDNKDKFKDKYVRTPRGVFPIN